MRHRKTAYSIHELGSFRRSDGFLIEVKVKEVHVHDAEFYMQLRCGWLIRGGFDQDGCTQYTKWRASWNGQIGWKKTMSNHIPINHSEVILVLYQKIGEQAHALCIQQLDCSKCLISAGVKRKFDIPLQLQDNRRGTMSGWIRALEEMQEPELDTFASRSRSYGLGTLLSKQRRNQEFPSYTDSYSNMSATASESVDLSIALDCAIPTKYFPLLTAKLVHKTILEKHPHLLNEPDSAVRFLTEVPNQITCFQIPAHRQRPANYEAVFIELGLLRTRKGNEIEWKVDPKLVDFNALKETLTALLIDYD